MDRTKLIERLRNEKSERDVALERDGKETGASFCEDASIDQIQELAEAELADCPTEQLLGLILQVTDLTVLEAFGERDGGAEPWKHEAFLRAFVQAVEEVWEDVRTEVGC